MIQQFQTGLILRGGLRSKRWSGFLLLGAAVLLTVVLAGCGLFGLSDTEAPSPPSDVTAQSGDRVITVEWSGVKAEDLAGYHVYRSDTRIANLDSATMINTEGLLTDTTHADDSVENGTTYHYVITAEDDSDNESAPSEEVRRTPFATPPRP